MAAAAWPQQHRIPAFGDWNYYLRDDGAGGVVHDWPPVTPCFNYFASGGAMRTTAARQKQSNNKRSSMPNARRMRVPAFGEWNHHHGDGGDGGNGNDIGNGAWPAVMTPFFDLATTHKAPRTGRRRRAGGDGGFDAAAKLATAAAEAPHQGHMQTRRSKVADSGAYAAATATATATARRSCFTVAKPVDDDLYGVPRDMMLYGNPPGPRKDGWLRILRLLGCSGCFSPSS